MIEVIHTFLKVFSLLITSMYKDFLAFLIILSLISIIVTGYRLIWYYRIVNRLNFKEVASC